VSRFVRPKFRVPKVPAAPGPVSQVNASVLRSIPLLKTPFKIPTFSLTKRSAIPGLAQAKAQLANARQALLTDKILNRPPLPPVPSAVQANPAQVQAFRQEMDRLFDQTSSLDEFGRPRDS
jgi:hypothetical protein